MDMGNEVAGSDEYEHADDERTDVDEQEHGKVDFHGYGINVIGGRIEFDESGKFLKQCDADAQDVAPEHAFADDEDGKPQEGVADGLVARAECLEDTYHVRAFEDDDEQAADHRETGHAYHQDEDNPYVEVEQVEPGEYLGIAFLYGG